MSFVVPLTPSEAAIYESLVVPRYVRLFGTAAVATLWAHPAARLAHIGCRTGYPAAEIAERLPGCQIVAVDSAPAALELARAKAAMLHNLGGAAYVLAEQVPTPLAGGEFTHALAIHPDGRVGDYGLILGELNRVLTPGGQLVMTLPLRGSFPSMYDLLREFALRFDQPHFGEAVELAASARPNPETIVEQCERYGFTDVDVGVELTAMAFDDGREFLEDPISRLVVGPDVLMSLPVEVGADDALGYAADAISKYWSESQFDLEVNIGCICARKA